MVLKPPIMARCIAKPVRAIFDAIRPGAKRAVRSQAAVVLDPRSVEGQIGLLRRQQAEIELAIGELLALLPPDRGVTLGAGTLGGGTAGVSRGDPS